ncbi:bifunctional 4-hydroxy-2-oxoglutarate aldolase/2-dehydro-3-deoxy-phosphogluconate aldolase [Cellulomonas sp. KRMCY2]|uniref:bifunctional 4-hydroxy-2-oxoglutarate aldolase/2-dehydro-3-deoxy-phosphogluconate aldolase n=1 Tax=Cellulomonas sp. KRMCY2 TaxID=1304865 RepID=UPI000685A248|nr:bifunctional 4-hydroxy-2-oxoglutarate aldolase/2-dehydro-3-deoxy-phosphogluconate aldolase [Cellulomonas sp. KRMCY2]
MTRLSLEHIAATSAFFETHLGTSGLMGIFRDLDPAETVRACGVAWDRGAGLVEVPVQSPAAFASLRAAVAAGHERGTFVGAGTVLTVRQVETVAEIGGTFCVSPGIDAEISLACERLGLLHLPGVATATEVGLAWKLGLRWVKAFPASVLGPAWVTAMLGPFPGLNVVCTGGMRLDTRSDYLAAGARAVAIGGRWPT